MIIYTDASMPKKYRKSVVINSFSESTFQLMCFRVSLWLVVSLVEIPEIQILELDLKICKLKTGNPCDFF